MAIYSGHPPAGEYPPPGRGAVPGPRGRVCPDPGEDGAAGQEGGLTRGRGGGLQPPQAENT